MKTELRKVIIAVIAILPLTFSSCHDEWIPGISGQGDIVQETVSLDDLTGFVSAIAADVYLTQGDEQEIVIKAQQNIIDNIDLDEIENGVWNIHYRQLVHYAKPVKIYITMPTLTKAGIAGSGEVVGLTAFTGLDRLKLFISGSGSMNLETESDEMNASITGSGNLNLSGTTGRLELTVTGSGSFHGRDLSTPEAEMTITGSGSARISVEDYLKVIVTGSGNVYYTGSPAVDVHVSGSGNVIRQ